MADRFDMRRWKNLSVYLCSQVPAHLIAILVKYFLSVNCYIRRDTFLARGDQDTYIDGILPYDSREGNGERDMMFNIKYPSDIRSLVESGCAYDGAASEGVVEGVEDDGGKYCKGGKAIGGVPGRNLERHRKIEENRIGKSAKRYC